MRMPQFQDSVCSFSFRIAWHTKDAWVIYITTGTLEILAWTSLGDGYVTDNNTDTHTQKWYKPSKISQVSRYPEGVWENILLKS